MCTKLMLLLNDTGCISELSRDHRALYSMLCFAVLGDTVTSSRGLLQAPRGLPVGPPNRSVFSGVLVLIPLPFLAREKRKDVSEYRKKLLP